MKACTLCYEEKPLDQFNRRARSKDGLQNVCRDCNKTRSQQYYSENREGHLGAVKERNKRYKKALRDFVVDYLKDHPCVDCGNSDIRVLEFDHRPGVDKLDGVARLVAAARSIEIVKAEIEKCEVRCRNCHTIKTYERMGGSWHDNYIMPL